MCGNTKKVKKIVLEHYKYSKQVTLPPLVIYCDGGNYEGNIVCTQCWAKELSMGLDN
jgi:hypothetical protein